MQSKNNRRSTVVSHLYSAVVVNHCLHAWDGAISQQAHDYRLDCLCMCDKNVTYEKVLHPAAKNTCIACSDIPKWKAAPAVLEVNIIVSDPANSRLGWEVESLST